MMPMPGQWERRSGSKSRKTPPELNDRADRIPTPDVASVVQGEATIGRVTGSTVRGSRDRVTWFKVSAGASVLLGATLVMMWVQQGHGTPLCATSFEAPRRLQLSRTGDREHLAADRGAALRIAQRYVASEPDTAARQQRLSACDAQLVQSIATTHGVTLDQVRTSADFSQ